MDPGQSLALINIDLLGHIFYAMILLGMLGVSWKSRYGWALRFAGEMGWVWLGFLLNLSSIYIWGLMFMAVDIYGFIHWSDSGSSEM